MGGMPGFAGHGREEFAIGQVYGIRWFQHLPGGTLQGAWAPWIPGANEAICLANAEHRREDVPVESCGCGFWAYWQRTFAPPWPGAQVLGIVKGYGPTLIGDLGFRCAKAEIVALHIPDPPPSLFGPRADPVAPADELRWIQWQTETENFLARKFGVPVYANLRTMMHKHPLTPEYRRAESWTDPFIVSTPSARANEILKRLTEALRKNKVTE